MDIDEDVSSGREVSVEPPEEPPLTVTVGSRPWHSAVPQVSFSRSFDVYRKVDYIILHAFFLVFLI